MAKDLNKAMIIGNLTRDPELRTTPNGQQVASFGVATNRQWKNQSGETQEQAEFHNVVVWGKLAEICNQYLAKGRRAYFEGRLQTQQWEGQDGAKRNRTEIVADDMILLDSRGGSGGGGGGGSADPAVNQAPAAPSEGESQDPDDQKKPDAKPAGGGPGEGQETALDDIPF
jgi:single-strand DNA-binding protein